MASAWQMLAACCVALVALGSAPRAAAMVAADSNRTAERARALDQSVAFGPLDLEGLHLLLRLPVYNAGVLQIEVSVDFLYPPQGAAFPAGYDIGSILVLDQLRDGSNGLVQLTQGGVGQDVVGLQFLSQPGQSIFYIVEVYGVPV